jgi:hypothetical protein
MAPLLPEEKSKDDDQQDRDEADSEPDPQIERGETLLKHTYPAFGMLERGANVVNIVSDGSNLDALFLDLSVETRIGLGYLTEIGMDTFGDSGQGSFASPLIGGL